MMRAQNRRTLSVEVVGARNLEGHAATDAYCVLQLCARGGGGGGGSSDGEAAAPSLSRAFRSPSVSATADPSWRFAAEFAAPETPAQARLRIQLFSEQHFFFDMFPKTPNGLPSGLPRVDVGLPDASPRRYDGLILDAFSGPSAGDCSFTDEGEGDAQLQVRRSAKKLSDDLATAGSDSEDVLTHSEDDEYEYEARAAPSLPSASSADEGELLSASDGACEAKETCGAYQSDDTVIGTVEISAALLCRPTRAATDGWYLVRGAASGELRVRTVWLDGCGEAPLTRKQREALFAQFLPADIPMRDSYGFAIPEPSRAEWSHLRSYLDCRERRRVEEWTAEFGDELPDVVPRGERGELSSRVRDKIRRLARGGIPRSWRQRVYMSVSGAREKQLAAGPEYYSALVAQAEALDTVTFRQIELDIDRTFGHSGTTICTESGRAQLRRILRAYSLRNPDVGYCQGLNFIVGFLTLIAGEEETFWLLIAICEDLFPGYYTLAMADIQTDMQVLKQLIADELPGLDEFSDAVGLPLELLGSQWLLCLFTTTFPAETVFRIFDYVLMEGSHAVFPVIMAHLRRMEPLLLELDDFHTVLSSIKETENACLDGDALMDAVAREAERLPRDHVERLRDKHRDLVRDERQRAERVRALNHQLAAAYEIPAFSPYASSLARFYEQAEGSSRSDVAFILTLLCHGLVWVAEHSKSWTR